MKILHAISSLSGGGAERQLAYLASQLSKRGHEVHVAYLQDGPNRSQWSDVYKITFHQIKFKHNYDINICFEISKVIKLIKPDIVHTWIQQMDVFAGTAALINRIPWVVREPNRGFSDRQTLKVRFRCYLCSKADIVVSNSEGGVSYWASKFPNLNCKLICNGIDIEAIDSVNGIFKGHILYAGRLENQKNTLKTIRALLNVSKKANAEILICGDGTLRDNVIKEIEQSGNGDRVKYLGYREDIWSLMKSASAFVSASNYEGHPNTVLEAAACGCPVVVSNIPEHRAFLDESMAIFVNGQKESEIMNGVLWVIENYDQAKLMANRAKKNVDEFSINRMASEYIEAYDLVLEKNNENCI